MFIAYPSSMRPHKSLGPLGSGQEGSIATQESIEKLPPAFNVVGSLMPTSCVNYLMVAIEEAYFLWKTRVRYVGRC